MRSTTNEQCDQVMRSPSCSGCPALNTHKEGFLITHSCPVYWALGYMERVVELLRLHTEGRGQARLGMGSVWCVFFVWSVCCLVCLGYLSPYLLVTYTYVFPGEHN